MNRFIYNELIIHSKKPMKWGAIVNLISRELFGINKENAKTEFQESKKSAIYESIHFKPTYTVEETITNLCSLYKQ